MKKIGVLLKEARKSCGLTLGEVSQRTKIHTEKLRAMEEGDYTSLPTKVFLRGLVLSYARDVKLDSAEFHELCQKEFSGSSDFHSLNGSSPENQASSPEIMGGFQFSNMTFTSVSFLFVGVLTLFIYMTTLKIQSYSKERKKSYVKWGSDFSQPWVELSSNPINSLKPLYTLRWTPERRKAEKVISQILDRKFMRRTASSQFNQKIETQLKRTKK